MNYPWNQLLLTIPTYLFTFISEYPVPYFKGSHFFGYSIKKKAHSQSIEDVVGYEIVVELSDSVEKS